MVIRKRKKKKDLEELAKKMFEAAEKEGYHLGGIVIKNLGELVEHLEKFTEKEAPWVASWVEYLGDSACSKKIRKCPGEFKDILKKRYKELNKYRK